MKLVAFTIVLDGMPFINLHRPIFHQLNFPWQWIVVEGASGNTADTAWCQKQKARLSEDGTHEYLNSIPSENVMHIYKKKWANKTEMCNAALEEIKEPCVLMQIDSDEIWTPKQIATIVRLFDERPNLGSMMFACRYFVGPKLITQGQGCFGDNDYEWRRAWRFKPDADMRFLSHEPPIMHGHPIDGTMGLEMSKRESRELGLVFDHFSYATEEQVAYKEAFYGYPGAVNAWRALQQYDRFPVPLNRFFHWLKSDDKAMVVRV